MYNIIAEILDVNKYIGDRKIMNKNKIKFMKF